MEADMNGLNKEEEIQKLQSLELKKRRTVIADTKAWYKELPIPPFLEWVKVKCQLHVDLETADENCNLTLYDYLRPYDITDELLVLLLQEDVAYELMEAQSKYSAYSKVMKRKILRTLQDLVTSTAMVWFQKSIYMGLCVSIDCLTLAIDSAETESHELACAYCFRAFCTQEVYPKSEEVLKDIKAAIKIWLDHKFSVEPNQMAIFYSVLDLLSIKGSKEVDGIYRIIFRLFDSSTEKQHCLGQLWGTKRTSHAFCASPVSEEFIKVLQAQYGDDADLTSFWLQCLKSFDHHKDVIAVFKQFCAPRSIKDGDLMTKTTEDMYISAYYYYDLADKLASTGHAVEALSYAQKAFAIRWYLYRQIFGENGSFQGFRTRKHILSLDLGFDLKKIYLSPWKIMECYLESELQLGLIRDLRGYIRGALACLTRGKNVCENRFPVIGTIFSSALVGVYHKGQRPGKAKTEDEDRTHLFKSIKEFPCEKCRSRLVVITSLERTSNVIQGFKDAESELSDSVWENTVSDSNFMEWDQVHKEVIKSDSVTKLVHLIWESMRRRLCLRLYAGLGKFLVDGTEFATNDTIGDLSLQQCVLQRISFLVCGNTFSPTISTELFLGRIQQDTAEFEFFVELAELLYDIVWWCLHARLNPTRDIFSTLGDSDFVKDMPRLFSWLVLAFVTSREVPSLFHKVAKLLAILHHYRHSFSCCEGLECFSPKWAAYFHQAALGSDIPGSFKQHLAPENVADLRSCVTSFYERLPSTPIICLSLIGRSYGDFLEQLVPKDSSDSQLHVSLLVTRLRLNRKPINLLLPILERIEGENRDWKNHVKLNNWNCRWGPEGSTEIENMLPAYRTIMEGIFLYVEHDDWTLKKLDGRLQNFIGKLETLWFGYAKHILLGEWSSCGPFHKSYERLRKKLKRKIVLSDDGEALSYDVVSLIGSSKEALNERRFLSQLQSQGVVKLTQQELDYIKKEVQILESTKSVVREPIIFVLDPQLQMLPLEHLAIMKDQLAYRMPSVWSIFHRMKKQSNTESPSIDPKQSFALLNPDNSFPECEATLSPLFAEKGLTVHTHKNLLSHDKFGELLEGKSLYIYMGHGTGDKYFPLENVERLSRCAAAILVGCSSASSRLQGQYPPDCAPLCYLHAGSPVIIGNLWEMYSGEGVSFLKQMLCLLFQESSKASGCTMATLLKAARRTRTLTYLDAPQICYGVPTSIN